VSSLSPPNLSTRGIRMSDRSFHPSRPAPDATGAGRPSPDAVRSPASRPDPDAAWNSLLRHELKTPLAGLLALAERIDPVCLRPGQRLLLDALVDCAGQLAGLVDRLVPAGPETSPGVGTAQDFDAERSLERTLMAHWPGARSRGIGLHLCLAAGVPR